MRRALLRLLSTTLLLLISTISFGLSSLVQALLLQQLSDLGADEAGACVWLFPHAGTFVGNKNENMGGAAKMFLLWVPRDGEF